MKSRVTLSLALTAAVLAVGCGKKGPAAGVKDVSGAKVQAKLIQNGQPFKPLPMEEVQVTFFEDGKDVKDRAESMGVYNAETGLAPIDGPTKKGIPAGKYRVTVRSQVYGGDNSNRFEKSFDVTNSPIVADVGPAEGQTFVIDLGRRSVTKQ